MAEQLFGSSPLSPLELYELQFSRVKESDGPPPDHTADHGTGTHAAATGSGAGAGADTGSGADRKLLNKLTRQLLRGLVQDVQPRRELRNTKLWVIAELPGCRDSGAWAGACPVGFAVKRNVDVELLRRRAKTVCEILIGADEEQEQQVEQVEQQQQEQQQQLSKPEQEPVELRKKHNYETGRESADSDAVMSGGLWAQSVGSVGALTAKEWSAAGYQ